MLWLVGQITLLDNFLDIKKIQAQTMPTGLCENKADVTLKSYGQHWRLNITANSQQGLSNSRTRVHSTLSGLVFTTLGNL